MENNREKISQRSIGLRFREWEFLSKNSDINLDEFVRQKIDEEIIRRSQFQFLSHRPLFLEEKNES